MVVRDDILQLGAYSTRLSETLEGSARLLDDFNRVEKQVQAFAEMQKRLMTPPVINQLQRTLDLIKLPDFTEEVNPHLRAFVDVAEHLNEGSRALERLMPQLGEMASVIQNLQPPRLDPFFNNFLEGKLAFEALFPSVLEGLSPLSPIIEQHRLAILTAPDEPSRREQLSLAFAAVKGATGIELPLDSSERVVQFLSFILTTFVMFLWTAIISQRAELARIQDVRELREVQRAQAETIAPRWTPKTGN